MVRKDAARRECARRRRALRLPHPNGTVAETEFYNAGSPAAKRYRYVFGSGSYDGLNRLKSADFSYYYGGWVTTLAHDLANINYDAAGNLTSMQRYRETGTLVDNLTHSYPGSSNRLSAVTDAVGATAETWDAESGSFTCDANGNLQTAPAPYAVTAVTYDHRNLPVSLTSGGTNCSCPVSTGPECGRWCRRRRNWCCRCGGLGSGRRASMSEDGRVGS